MPLLTGPLFCASSQTAWRLFGCLMATFMVGSKVSLGETPVKPDASATTSAVTPEFRSPETAASSPVPAATGVFAFDPARHMRVSEVKPGMKGFGLTVFRGTKIEKFDVEVVSVVPKQFGPDLDVVLIMCKDDYVKHTGPVQGMSGSPIFLYDDSGKARMIGAFAYGWSLQKDPLAGVQPIEYMLELSARPAVARDDSAVHQQHSNSTAGEHSAARLDVARADAIVQLLSEQDRINWQATLARVIGSNRTGMAMQSLPAGLRPMSLPLSVGGVPPHVASAISPLLESSGFQPFFAGAGGVAPENPPIEPGSALVVPMMSGDLDLSAFGTATEVIGDRVVGFGHPSFSDGYTALPMSSGFVHTIVANLNASFKVGSSAPIRGVIDLDTTVGVGGSIGKDISLIPIRVQIDSDVPGRSRVFNYRAVKHDQFTPMLAAMAIQSSISQMENLPAQATLTASSKLLFAGGRELTSRVTATTAEGAAAPIGPVILNNVLPVVTALRNPFEKTELESVDIQIKVEHGIRETMLMTARPAKPTYKAGETASIVVMTQDYRGARSESRVEFALPDHLVEGSYTITLSNADSFVSSESQVNPGRFEATNLDELFSVFSFASQHDPTHLYIRLNEQNISGARIEGTDMPKLPASRLGRLAATGRPGVTPITTSHTKSIPMNAVLQGEVSFELQIKSD